MKVECDLNCEGRDISGWIWERGQRETQESWGELHGMDNDLDNWAGNCALGRDWPKKYDMFWKR